MRRTFPRAPQQCRIILWIVSFKCLWASHIQTLGTALYSRLAHLEEGNNTFISAEPAEDSRLQAASNLKPAAFAPGLILGRASVQHVYCDSLCPGGHHGNDASPRRDHQHEETDCFLLFPCRCFLFSATLLSVGLIPRIFVQKFPLNCF